MSYTDARGSTLSLFKQPKRIISLVPSQTELLYHLGLDNEVVGITKFCVHPQEWFKTKTRVGGTKNADMELIKSLQPDLIIANKEENVKEQIEALAAQFPVWVTDVCNLSHALQMIEDLGTLTGKTEMATFLKAHIGSAFGKLNETIPPTRHRVCYLIWNDPILTVGGDTFIHDMLHQAGFENIFGDKMRYPQILIEQLQEVSCELLLLSSEPYPFAEKHRAFFQTHLPHTKILLVDGAMFSWYGSRLQWAPAYFENLHAQLRNSA